MRASLAGYSAVFVAKLFNPSVFREPWLRAHGALEPDDALLPGYIFSDQAVQVATARYVMTIVPQQLVFAPASPELATELFPGMLQRLLMALPHPQRKRHQAGRAARREAARRLPVSRRPR